MAPPRTLPHSSGAGAPAWPVMVPAVAAVLVGITIAHVLVDVLDTGQDG